MPLVVLDQCSSETAEHWSEYDQWHPEKIPSASSPYLALLDDAASITLGHSSPPADPRQSGIIARPGGIDRPGTMGRDPRGGRLTELDLVEKIRADRPTAHRQDSSGMMVRRSEATANMEVESVASHVASRPSIAARGPRLTAGSAKRPGLVGLPALALRAAPGPGERVPVQRR